MATAPSTLPAPTRSFLARHHIPVKPALIALVSAAAVVLFSIDAVLSNPLFALSAALFVPQTLVQAGRAISERRRLIKEDSHDGLAV